MKALYRKLNDRSQSSSTYHKKDGTAVRAKLKQYLIKSIKSGGGNERLAFNRYTRDICNDCTIF